MLVDLISIIASGQRAAVMSQGQDEEEMEKRLGASFLAGDPLITIDNCEQPLGGQLLCQALTQTRLKIRILGKSEQMELPTTACVFATGNNLTIEGDLTRRTLLSSIDTRQDRPELTKYNSNPIEDAIANRATYVADGLTICALTTMLSAKQTLPFGFVRAMVRLGSWHNYLAWSRRSVRHDGADPP